MLSDIERVEMGYQYLDDGKPSKTNKWIDKPSTLPSLVTIKIRLQDDREFSRVVSFSDSSFDAEQFASSSKAQNNANEAEIEQTAN
jgi:hypothetical protein